MNRIFASYLWLIPLTLLFPVLQLAIFFARFNRLGAEILSESIVFAPMGFISGIVLIYLHQRAAHKWWVIIGYVIAIPFALIGGLLSGLILRPLIGVTLFGSMPLIIGSVIGYMIGRK